MNGDREMPSTSAANQHLSDSSPAPGKLAVYNRGGPKYWCVWRIWCKGIFDELEEHFKSSNYLYSQLWLARLFLHKIGTWEADIRFHNPTSLNFRRVLVGQVNRIKFVETDSQLLLRVTEVPCAESMELRSSNTRIIVEANSVLAHVLRQSVRVGDYIVVWGGKRTQLSPSGSSTSGVPVLLLNDDLADEPSFLIHYRHDGRFSMPMGEKGVFQVGGVRGSTSEICMEGHVDNDIVHVQQISSKFSSQSGWRVVAGDTETEPEDTVTHSPILKKRRRSSSDKNIQSKTPATNGKKPISPLIHPPRSSLRVPNKIDTHKAKHPQCKGKALLKRRRNISSDRASKSSSTGASKVDECDMSEESYETEDEVNDMKSVNSETIELVDLGDSDEPIETATPVISCIPVLQTEPDTGSLVEAGTEIAEELIKEYLAGHIEPQRGPASVISDGVLDTMDDLLFSVSNSVETESNRNLEQTELSPRKDSEIEAEISSVEFVPATPPPQFSASEPPFPVASDSTTHSSTIAQLIGEHGSVSQTPSVSPMHLHDPIWSEMQQMFGGCEEDVVSPGTADSLSCAFDKNSANSLSQPETQQAGGDRGEIPMAKSHSTSPASVYADALSETQLLGGKGVAVSPNDDNDENDVFLNARTGMSPLTEFEETTTTMLLQSPRKSKSVEDNDLEFTQVQDFLSEQRQQRRAQGSPRRPGTGNIGSFTESERALIEDGGGSQPDGSPIQFSNRSQPIREDADSDTFSSQRERPKPSSKVSSPSVGKDKTMKTVTRTKKVIGEKKVSNSSHEDEEKAAEADSEEASDDDPFSDSYSEFNEKGLVQFFDLDPKERSLFEVRCNILSLNLVRKSGTEFYMRVEDGTLPCFSPKRFFRDDYASPMDKRKGQRITREEELNPLLASQIDIIVRQGTELYAVAEKNVGKSVTLQSVALEFDRKERVYYFSMNGSMSDIVTSKANVQKAGASVKTGGSPTKKDNRAQEISPKRKLIQTQPQDDSDSDSKNSDVSGTTLPLPLKERKKESPKLSARKKSPKKPQMQSPPSHATKPRGRPPKKSRLQGSSPKNVSAEGKTRSSSVKKNEKRESPSEQMEEDDETTSSPSENKSVRRKLNFPEKGKSKQTPRRFQRTYPKVPTPFSKLSIFPASRHRRIGRKETNVEVDPSDAESADNSKRAKASSPKSVTKEKKQISNLKKKQTRGRDRDERNPTPSASSEEETSRKQSDVEDETAKKRSKIGEKTGKKVSNVKGKRTRSPGSNEKKTSRKRTNLEEKMTKKRSNVQEKRSSEEGSQSSSSDEDETTGKRSNEENKTPEKKSSDEGETRKRVSDETETDLQQKNSNDSGNTGKQKSKTDTKRKRKLSSEVEEEDNSEKRLKISKSKSPRLQRVTIDLPKVTLEELQQKGKKTVKSPEREVEKAVEKRKTRKRIIADEDSDSSIEVVDVIAASSPPKEVRKSTSKKPSPAKGLQKSPAKTPQKSPEEVGRTSPRKRNSYVAVSPQVASTPPRPRGRPKRKNLPKAGNQESPRSLRKRR